MAVDYVELLKAWEEWSSDPDNGTVVRLKAPELLAYDYHRGYCGPTWRPRPPWSVRKLTLSMSLALLAWLIPDCPFGVKIAYAGFWHDRLYVMGGDRHARAMADSIFLEIIWDKVKTAEVSRWRKAATYAASIPYWLAVRLFGWLCFSYKEKTHETH
jgi:hypothetical protein